MRRSGGRADLPPRSVVVAGGVGVAVVLAFVAAVAVGGAVRSTPGDRVAIVRAGGPAALAVLAGRCLDQRVTAVQLQDASGSVLWRIESRKGSIERRYVVGGEVPLEFVEVTPLARRPSGPVRADVTFEQGDETTSDARVVDAAAAPAQGDTLEGGAPACGAGEGPGATTWLFASGAALVLATYVGMLLRFRRSS